MKCLTTRITKLLMSERLEPSYDLWATVPVKANCRRLSVRWKILSRWDISTWTDFCQSCQGKDSTTQSPSSTLSVRIILQQKFLPAAHEDLLAAFRTLDPENSGHIEKDVVTQLFTEEGEAFSQEEMTEFCNAALDPITKSIHYREFVHFLGVDDNF